MKEDSLKAFYNSMFEFVTVYHQRIGSIFNMKDSIVPRCNKSQQKALFIISKREKITPTDLGKCMDMRKGSLTTLIDSLQYMKLVKRESDNDDRRKTWLYLTDEGRKYLEMKLELFEQIFMQMFQSVPEPEVEKMTSDITYITEKMRDLRGGK